MNVGAKPFLRNSVSHQMETCCSETFPTTTVALPETRGRKPARGGLTSAASRLTDSSRPKSLSNATSSHPQMKSISASNIADRLSLSAEETICEAPHHN